ncbi:hypothetical protein [Dactylosporangium sp. NPDC051541]|uniref:hypothetical protein n=1 Tax=Dactylosporangium sp. NPDC051541 TaxID=3363977 RepID=UPI00378E0E32
MPSRRGRTGRGIELLDQGRGVLWAQPLDTRVDLDAVRLALDADADAGWSRES